MGLLGLVLGIAVALTTVEIPQQGEARSYFNDLQGTWVLQTVEWFGIRTEQNPRMDKVELRLRYCQGLAEERELKPDSRKWQTSLTFEGKNFIWRERVGVLLTLKTREVTTRGKYQLDGNRSPKRLITQSTLVVCREEDGSQWDYPEKKTCYFIFRINGDVLQLGLSPNGQLKSLPSGFVTGLDGRNVVFTFKREKRKRPPTGARQNDGN